MQHKSANKSFRKKKNYVPKPRFPTERPDVKAIINWLAKRYPALFPATGVPPKGQHIKPLATGILDALTAQAEGRFTREQLDDALGWWCSRLNYLMSLAYGRYRHDLSGGVQPIKPEHQQMMKNRLAKIKRRQKHKALMRRHQRKTKRFPRHAQSTIHTRHPRAGNVSERRMRHAGGRLSLNKPNGNR